MGRGRWPAWQVYLAFGGALIAIYYAVRVDELKSVLVGTLGLSASVAIVAGVRRNRPAVR